MISKSVVALAGLVALVWAGSASAQSASNITTTCPVSFTCAFSAAESLSLNTKSGQPGQPDVYIGYIAFNSSGAVSVSMMQMQNGTLSPQTFSGGTCTNGTGGVPAKIDFPSPGPEWMFVTVNSGSGSPELDFIQSQDTAGTTSVTNAVRVGVCRSPAP